MTNRLDFGDDLDCDPDPDYDPDLIRISQICMKRWGLQYLTEYLLIDLTLRPLCFFLCFRWTLDLGRTLPKSVFFLPSARIRLLPISKKIQLISGDKQNIPKKASLFQEIKNIFSAMFFFGLFFFAALNNFF